MNKLNVDLSTVVKWQTQFDSIFGNSAQQNVACNKACKKMIGDSGFKTTDATGRIDVVVYDQHKNLIKGKDWDKGVVQLHKNCDENKPTMVAVNRGDHDVNNANPASNHYVVIVGRRYNEKTGCYEYPFFDPGTHHVEMGASKQQFFTLKNGMWKGVSRYCNIEYTITEIRPTT